MSENKETKKKNVNKNKNIETKSKEKVAEKVEPKKVKEPRKFMPGDMILCRCVRPNSVVFYSQKTDTRYEFGGYGDVNEIDYSDLQRLKASRSSVLYEPKILIEDEELREQWAKDLEPIMAEYDTVYSTEQIFDKPIEEFRDFLRKSSDGMKSLIKSTAVDLVNENKVKDLQKIIAIDDILGTKLKEFI